MASIDSTGAALKTLTEYLDELKTDYRDIDEAWNLQPESPDGQALAIWAEVLANLDEAVVAAYQSVDPRSASGIQLDRIAAITGLERQEATASTATVQLSGTAGTVVPAGTEFRNTETDTLWALDSEVTLDGSGNGSGTVTCQTVGPEPAAVGSISVIATPVAGLSSVNNADAAALGTAEESDLDFRIRRQESVSRVADNQVDSIRSVIAEVDGVNRVRVVENDTPTADSNGVDPHSIAIFVNGGDVDEVAAAIAAQKNPGTGLNRDNTFANKETVATTTPAGNPFTAVFYRPELTTVYVEVTISGTYDAAAVKQAIVDYANGTLLGEGTGFDRTGFAIGDDVPVGKLYTPTNRAVGDDGIVESIEIGTSAGSLGTAKITIPFNGLAVFDVDSITVTAA